MPPVFGPVSPSPGRLVVLAGWHGEERLAVGQRQHAGLLAVQPLLDHQLVAGFAEFLLGGDAVDGLERLLAIVADDHAFAGRQSVGLDDDRHVVAIFQIGDRPPWRIGTRGSRRSARRRGAAVPCRRPCCLRARRRPSSGPNARRPASPSASTSAGRERRFGTDDRQVDRILAGELHEPRHVGRPGCRRSPRRAPCRRCPARRTRGRPAGSGRFSRPAHVPVRRFPLPELSWSQLSRRSVTAMPISSRSANHRLASAVYRRRRLNDSTSEGGVLELGRGHRRPARRPLTDGEKRRLRKTAVDKVPALALHLEEDCEKCHKPLIPAGLGRYNLLQVNGLSVTGWGCHEAQQRLGRDSRKSYLRSRSSLVVLRSGPAALRLTMADKSKMTVAEMLAAARKADATGDAPVPKPPAVGSPAAEEGSSPAPLPPSRRSTKTPAGGKPSTADILAMARAKKAESRLRRSLLPSRRQSRPPRRRRREERIGRCRGPVDTQSILAAARKGDEAWPDDQGRSCREGRRRRPAAQEGRQRSDRRAADAGQARLRQVAGRADQRRGRPSGGRFCSACRPWHSVSPR